MAKFEAHITMDKIYAPRLKPSPTGDAIEIADWKYSAIDDDPVMGQNAYCYLTGYDTDAQNLLDRMLRVVDILYELHIGVLRTKVEQIIWDSKTGVNEGLTAN